MNSYELAALEAFAAELVGAGFGPVPGEERLVWIGPTPPSVAEDTGIHEMVVRIPETWPVRAAKVYLPGLVGQHVTNEGLVCLWADDDPAQTLAVTFALLLVRLREWIDADSSGFSKRDQALDSYAFFNQLAAPSAEIDLPALLRSPTNGLTRPLHANPERTWTFSRAAQDHPLEGVLFYRSALSAVPRDFESFRSVLTRAQRNNLDYGLARRAPAERGAVSGGYDFALLIWPRYGAFDVLFISFEGEGAQLGVSAHHVFPNDSDSRLRRAGPRAGELASKRVLLVGGGSVGGQVALSLASSGVGYLKISDSAALRTVNLTRHVLTSTVVGLPKVLGLAARVEDAAPWCEVEMEPSISEDPDELVDDVSGFDVVVDCTGMYAVTIGLVRACASAQIPLVTGAIYHSGDIYRVRRQVNGDRPILERTLELGYPVIPDNAADAYGFLELGCTSPVHNAPPVVTTKAAGDVALVVLDLLLGDLLYGADQMTVIRPLDEAPFDHVGSWSLPLASAGNA